MLAVTQQYKDVFASLDGEIDYKVTYGTTEFDAREDIVNLRIESTLNSNLLPTIGGVCSARLELQLINNDKVPTEFEHKELRVYAGAVIPTSGAVEWNLIGVFYLANSSYSLKDGIVTVEAYDIINSLTEKVYFPTTGTTEFDAKAACDYVSDASSQIDIIKTYELDNVFKFDLNGIGGDLRSVLERLAIISGSNLRVSYVNGNGKDLELCRVTDKESDIVYTIPEDLDESFERKSISPYKITKLANTNRGTVSDSSGSIEEDKPDITYGTDEGLTVTFSIPETFDTEEQIYKIYDQCYPVSFYAYELQLATALPFIQVGDVVKFTDTLTGEVLPLQVYSHTLELGENITSTFSCEGIEIEDEDTGAVDSNVNNNQISKDGIYINNLEVNGISKLHGSAILDNGKSLKGLAPDGTEKHLISVGYNGSIFIAADPPCADASGSKLDIVFGNAIEPPANTYVNGERVRIGQEFCSLDFNSSGGYFRPQQAGINLGLYSSANRWKNGFFSDKLYAGNATIQTSDLKDKKYCSPIEEELATNLIMGLNPITFKFKKEDNAHNGKRWKAGFGAQPTAELCRSLDKEIALCEAHVINEDGSWTDYDYDTMKDTPDEQLAWGMDYSGIVAPLVKVVQSQQNRIDTLENDKKELESRVELLEEKMEELLKLMTPTSEPSEETTE